MSVQRFETGVKWESKVGYSRAIKVGNIIEISGTVAIKDGQVFGPEDPYAQTKRIIKIFEEALTYFDSNLNDIVRTRIYVTNIQDHWQEVGRAHGEAFGDIRPATSMIEVSALISPEFLVEIEATAHTA